MDYEKRIRIRYITKWLTQFQASNGGIVFSPISYRDCTNTYYFRYVKKDAGKNAQRFYED